MTLQNEIAIEVKGVSFSYTPGKPVLENVDLVVKKGDFVALLGPNGAGKTTLLKLILGLLPLRKGEIKIFGKPVKEIDSIRSWIGYVPQSLTQNRRIPLTVEDVVMLGRFPYMKGLKFPSRQDKKKVQEVLELVGMSQMSKRLFSRLSGGQMQRVLIAKALVTEPRLLILDEPDTGLDPVMSEGFYKFLNRLHSELSLTILLVSHDVMAVSEIVKSVVCINRRIVAHGRPESVFTSPNLECLYGKQALLFGHGVVPHLVVDKKEHGE